MRLRTHGRPFSPASLLICGLGLMPFAGCEVSGWSSMLTGLLGQYSPATPSTIIGSVTSASPDTGLPRTLQGTVTGYYQGTYEETILEVFFDDMGFPIAATSRTKFTLDAPAAGTITGLNLIIVLEPVLSTDGVQAAILDDQGNPVPIGLKSAATGEIIHGTGAFAGASGELQADSTIMFGGGDAGLGALESTLVIRMSS